MLARIPIEHRTPDQTRLCRARQEQAFMEEHGGWAPRMVFAVFSALGCLPGLADQARLMASSIFRGRQNQEFQS